MESLHIPIKKFITEFIDHKEIISIIEPELGCEDDKILFGPDRSEFFVRYGDEKDHERTVLWIEHVDNHIAIYVDEQKGWSV
jgi:hypothetical protein